jgi:FSR family fosmidomycin resistance protein-like MFS transporter
MLAHFSHHLIAALLQPLLPFIRDDFHLDYTQSGLLVSAFNLSYGISQLPGGWLTDRIGARIVIIAGISGVAVCGFLVGLSPTYIMVVVCLVLLGVIGGGYHPAASPLVSASVEERNRGRALGFHQIGGTASFFLTPLIAAGIASALGWRGTFIALAIPTFIFGIVLYILLGRRQDIRKTQPGTPSGSTDTPATPSHLRGLVPFIILGVVLQVLIYSTISFIPLFVVDYLEASEEAGATMFAVFQFAGLWAGPLGGYLSDRLGKVPVMVIVSLIAGPAIYLLNLVSFGWSISAVLILIGTCMYIGMPVSEAYIISHTSERNRSTVLGIYYLASRGGPGLIMPVIGLISDRSSFGNSFTIVGAIILAVAVVCSAFLWRSRD